MKKSVTTRLLSRRLLLIAGCLAALTAVQAANITVDGINYTTKTDGTATVKFTGDFLVSTIAVQPIIAKAEDFSFDPGRDVLEGCQALLERLVK